MTLISTTRSRLMAWGLTLSAGLAALLSGCTSTPLPSTKAGASLPAAAPGAPPVSAVPSGEPRSISKANSPREYRIDAASHLYGKNQDRIFHGQMPPLLYAVGVLQVEVDGKGRVTGTSWMRAPKHAPEVMAEIERTVRAAAPYPAPLRLGRVTYTDTWLWHKSGTFQLDTLTEGQM